MLFDRTETIPLETVSFPADPGKLPEPDNGILVCQQVPVFDRVYCPINKIHITQRIHERGIQTMQDYGPKCHVESSEGPEDDK